MLFFPKLFNNNDTEISGNCLHLFMTFELPKPIARAYNFVAWRYHRPKSELNVLDTALSCDNVSPMRAISCGAHMKLMQADNKLWASHKVWKEKDEASPSTKIKIESDDEDFDKWWNKLSKESAFMQKGLRRTKDPLRT